MNKLIVIFFLLIYQLNYSQKKEEVYVYFKHGKGQERLCQIEKEKPTLYIFHDDNSFHLVFGFVKLQNPEIRIENKSFIKKNNILYADELSNMGTSAALNSLNGKKIFIIDTEEFKKNKIVLREVRVYNDMID
jgi:hypothetical protein